MLKLIRLEWKKNNVGKYIRNVVIMSALICLFIFALCYLGIANVVLCQEKVQIKYNQFSLFM